MKKIFNSITVLLIASTIIFTSCKDNGEGGGVIANKITEPFSIEVTGDAINDITAHVDCDKAYGSTPYFVGVVDAAAYDATYAEDSNGLLTYASNCVDVDFSSIAVDDKYVFAGNADVDISDAWDLDKGVRYYVFAFGVASDGVSLATNIELKEFRTTIAEGPTAVVKRINDGSIVLDVNDNGTTSKYAVVTLTKSKYDDVLAQNSTQSDFDIMCDYVAYAIENGQSFSTYLGDASITISQDQDGASLRANTDYKIFIFSYNKSEGTILSAPFVLDVTTEDYPEGTPHLKSITVTDVSYTNACVNVDAGDYEGNYFVLTLPKSDCDPYCGDDEALMTDYIQSFKDAGFNFSTTTGNTSLVFNGNNSFNANMLWLLSSETVHYSFVVGIGPSFGEQVTPVLRSEPFTTLEQPELTLDIEYVDEGKASAKFVVTPNHDDISYVSAFMRHSTCEDSDAEDLAQTYLMTGYMSYYLFTGPMTIELSDYNILEGVDYKVFCFGYDYYAERVTSEMFSYIFTGLAVNAANNAPMFMDSCIAAPKNRLDAIKSINKDNVKSNSVFR